MARPGEKVVTQAQMEARLRKLVAMIESVASFMVFSNSGGEKKNFSIVFDIQSINGAGTAVTFSPAFKAGTVPAVTGSSYNKLAAFSVDGAPTATGFTGVSTKILDGSALTTICMWIAIGER